MIFSVDQKLLEVRETIGVSAIFVGAIHRGHERRHSHDSPPEQKCLKSMLKADFDSLYSQVKMKYW